ncbi:MAG: nucleoside triphosphate pyrophosphohydrolase [Candidatus Eremiobacteraeota bacterium]|nr:nucleoside triphosphate pyrophosphohydrolase [Candidatus Eremiobacteraeota bacterium]
MSVLRGEDGCPWDKEQTHRSLLPYVIEEAYEVVESVEDGDMNRLCEESGDLLLQIVFQAQIAKEAGEFDIKDVCSAINDKLIRRHPHVFSPDGKKLSRPEEVTRQWEEIKLTQEEGKRESLMDGIPRDLPALLAAQRVQERASGVGFDWDDATGPLEKVSEELGELKSVMNGPREKMKEEMGDILFSVVNFCRFLGINAEEALRNSVKKFVRRFKKVEEGGFDTTLEIMEERWQNAKNEE